MRRSPIALVNIPVRVLQDPCSKNLPVDLFMFEKTLSKEKWTSFMKEK